jgi:hypothetical protein
VNSRCESSQYSFHVWKKFKFERKSELDRANCPAESDRNPLPNEQRRSWIGDPNRKRVGSESKNEEDFLFIEVFRRVFRLSLPCPVFFPFRRRIPWHPYHIGGISGILYIFRAACHYGKRSSFLCRGSRYLQEYFDFHTFFLLMKGSGRVHCYDLQFDQRFDLRFGACVGTPTHGNAVPISSPAQLITSTKYYDTWFPIWNELSIVQVK